VGAPRAARAQACCAGSSAVTPGRLVLHENALAGFELRSAALLGTYDSRSAYHAAAPGTGEADFEEDVFASARVLERGQVSLLVPFVESWRTSRTTGAEFGGGVGDVNASARYDFTWAREVSYLPGIALLLGLTVPSGRAPESARLPLASDATGVGAVQLNAGLALERVVDRWLFGLSGLVAKRLSRRVQGLESDLGTQFTLLGNAGYVFADEASLALAVTFTAEGDASIDRVEASGTARRLLRFALAGSLPLGDRLRLQASTYLDPPFSGAGENQPSTLGFTSTVIGSLF